MKHLSNRAVSRAKLLLVSIVAIFVLGICIHYVVSDGPPHGGWDVTGNFSFYGYVQNSTNFLNVSANVTVWTEAMGPENPARLLTTVTSAASTGYFQVNVTPPTNYFGPYKITVIQYENGNATYRSSILPPLPGFMLTNAFNGSTLYVAPAATIFVYGVNASYVQRNISGMVQDAILGMPMDEFFNEVVWNRSVVVPVNRNYSVVVVKNFDPATNEGTPPLSFTVTDVNLTQNQVFPVMANLSVQERFVAGNISIIGPDGNVVTNANLTDISAYITGAGMMPTMMPPIQIGEWGQFGPGMYKGQDGLHTNGTFFNITLLGAAQGINFVIEAFGKNGTQGASDTAYYGAFYNFTLTNSDIWFNITLKPLAGAYSLGTFSSPANTSRTKISIVYNDSSTGNLTGVTQGGFSEISFTYKTADHGNVVLKLMAQPNQSGVIELPFLQNENITLKIFSNQFAPVQKKLNLSLASIQIELKSFDMKDPTSGSDFQIPFNISFYSNTEACNVQYPNADSVKGGGCLIMSFVDDPTGQSRDNFNPLKLMMAGKANIRIVDPTNGFITYFVGVDLLASGPPDAAFSTTPTEQNTSGGKYNSVYRFGSGAPDFYDYVRVGIPYNQSLFNENSNTINYTLRNVYDEDWNQKWNGSLNPNATNIPTEFVDYNVSWFNRSLGGIKCTADPNNDCYINKSNNMLWIKLPHFSGGDDGFDGSTSDLIVPGLVVQSPQNATTYLTRNISLNYTASDANRDKCWYQNYTGTENISLSGCANTTIVVPGDSSYGIVVYVNDTSNNMNSSIIYFTVDAAAPMLTVASPVDSATYNTSSVALNFVVTHSGLDKCWYRNTTGANNITITSCANSTLAPLYDGVLNITVYANDTSGNTNISASITFNVTSVPLLVVSSPANNTWYNSTNVSLNFVAGNPDISACWYQNISWQNLSMSCFANTSFTAPQGHSNITVYINDTTNRLNSTRIFFHVDTTAPTVTQTCTPTSVAVGAAVTCTCNATDVYNATPTLSYTASPSTSTAGTFSTTCTATDSAGNAGTDSDSYTVTSSSSSSSSGGGGGGSAATGQTKSWTSIAANTEGKMTFTRSDLSYLNELLITPSKTKTNVDMNVQALSAKPSGTVDVPGKAYQYFKITPTNLPDTDIKSATLKFTVTKAFVDANGGVSKIALYRYKNSKWNKLTTTSTGSTSTTYSFESTVPGFSDFAIVAEGAATTPTVQTTTQEQTNTTQDSTAQQAASSPGETQPTTLGAPAEENGTAKTGKTATFGGLDKIKPVYIWIALAAIVVIVAVILVLKFRGGKKKPIAPTPERNRTLTGLRK